MAVGSDAKITARSYTAFAKEASFGTYATVTTALEPLSVGFKTEIESQVLETMNVNRGASKRVQTNKNVAGPIESYLHNEQSPAILIAALGPDTVTSAAGSTSTFTHSFSSANHATFGSLSFNTRKGESQVFEYVGGRVSQLTISGEVGEPIRMTAEMIFKDSSLSTNDIGSALSVSTLSPWVYHQAQFIYAATPGSLTTTAAEPIQSFELVINNNVEDGGPARQLGSNLREVLPVKNRSVELTVSQRFDTTTAYNRFTSGTQGSIRIQLDGSIISGSSSTTHQLIIDLPKVFQNTNDPELGGPGEVLTSEFTYDVLVDNPNTTTGKDIAMTVRNGTASY